jgi:hypothetical protein
MVQARWPFPPHRLSGRRDKAKFLNDDRLLGVFTNTCMEIEI